MNTRSTHRPTIGHVIRRAVLTSAATVVIAGAAFATVAALADQATIDMSFNGSTAADPTTSEVPPADSPADSTADSTADSAVDSAVDAVIGQHECWTEPADMPSDMQGRLPGHVVVTIAAEPTTPVYSNDLVGPALDEVFGAADEDPTFTVHAFCR